MSENASHRSRLNATLAVLAGGEGRRMGAPKAWLTLSGRPILERLVNRLAWQGPTLLVTSPGRSGPPGSARFDLEVIDRQPDKGPLQGVLTALTYAATEQVVIIPTDMPLISAHELEWLLGRLDDEPNAIGAMMRRRVAGEVRLEPMPLALSVRRARDLVESQLSSGRPSLMALADVAGIHVFECPSSWPSDMWINLNYPADRDAFEAMANTLGEAARST